MAAIYKVVVGKDFSTCDREFRAGDIIQGTFEQLDNRDYFVSDLFCIKAEDTGRIISCDMGIPIVPVILIITSLSLYTAALFAVFLDIKMAWGCLFMFLFSSVCMIFFCLYDREGLEI